MKGSIKYENKQQVLRSLLFVFINKNKIYEKCHKIGGKSVIHHISIIRIVAE